MSKKTYTPTFFAKDKPRIQSVAAREWTKTVTA